ACRETKRRKIRTAVRTGGDSVRQKSSSLSSFFRLTLVRRGRTRPGPRAACAARGWVGPLCPSSGAAMPFLFPADRHASGTATPGRLVGQPTPADRRSPRGRPCHLGRRTALTPPREVGRWVHPPSRSVPFFRAVLAPDAVGGRWPG